MQSSVLDRYIFRESPLHRLDPRVKLLVTVGFILGNLLLPEGAWPGYLAAWLATLLISHVAGLGPWFALQRSFIALPFMLAALSVLFAVPGRELFRVPPGGWVVTDGGLLRFLAIMARSWLAVQMVILLTATTSFPDLTHALRHLRVPPVLVAIISFMYRYLFVLVEEGQRMLRARASRSAALPGRPSGGRLAWRARVAGNMAGQLLLRSMERADRVYLAMVARGYRGQLLTMNRHTMGRRDWQGAGIAVAALLLIQLVGRLLM